MGALDGTLRVWLRLRLTLRELAILVLAAECFLACVEHRARVQREAVATIKKAGGEVYYHWEWQNGKSVLARPGPLTRWLAEKVGVEYVGRVVRVTTSMVASKGELMQIGRLSGLTELVVCGAVFDNEAAGHLSDLRSLRTLDLQYCDVNDSVLSRFRNLRELEQLRIHSCSRLSDNGLANLRPFARLRKLTLVVPDGSVGDSGLVHVVELRRLQGLSLSRGCMVTDSGLASLGKLTELVELGLSLPDLTENGVTHLRQLRNLKKLDLTLRQPSNEGIKKLKYLANVHRLTLLRTERLTGGGLVALNDLSTLQVLVIAAPSRDIDADQLRRNLPTTLNVYFLPPDP